MDKGLEKSYELGPGKECLATWQHVPTFCRTVLSQRVERAFTSIDCTSRRRQFLFTMNRTLAKFK
uniref:Uncharacterized protein n=1 Tax=Arundo donax TaxID=35708 RepID=A0A0A9AZJ0_ARUDO